MIYDIIVIGGGPAGLGAAISAARNGAGVLLIDENSRLGGQLFKQTHKFFGSREHYAGFRGFSIGEELVREASGLNIRTLLDTRVLGFMDDGSVAVDRSGRMEAYTGKKVIIAVGARENALSFPGWTLPGVMTAGAAQTFANMHGVLIGKKILMIGSGNVGIITAYQLIQAGAQVAGIVDAAPAIKGYGVHAAKLQRLGVRFFMNHTILQADGKEHIKSATVVKVDKAFKPITGTEKTVEVDTVLLAVGLTPRVELARMLGCKTVYEAGLGGTVVCHDENMRTSLENVYVCGDLTGIEEANTALDEGRLAGLAAAESLGISLGCEATGVMEEIRHRLNALRIGPYGQERGLAKERMIKAAGIV